ncbi:MAG: adenylate kinase [Candidatus Micrarchaeota archaeon]
MRLILFGEPGSGKGTLSAMLSHRLGINHISTGNLFRSEIARGTELGREVGSLITEGRLVPDAIVISVVRGLFESTDFHKGFVLDGFPRTLEQARDLDELLHAHSWTLDGIVFLKAERDELVRRLSSRRVCRSCAAVFNTITYPTRQEGVCDKCGGGLYQREDDAADAVKVRLGVYEKQTAPMIDYYSRKGLLKLIDTTGDDAEKSYAKLMMALGKIKG